MNCRLIPCVALLLVLRLMTLAWQASPACAATADQESIADQESVTDLCSVIHPSDTRIAWRCVTIKPGQTLESLFGRRWVDVARFNRVDRRHIYPGVRIKVPVNLDEIRDFSPMPKTCTPAQKYPKFILIDLPEQFLGAYEFGALAFSAPVSTGEPTDQTPNGRFRITAYSKRHFSSIYNIEGTDIPYPMQYALRFFISRQGVSYWIHGRDVPGYPLSHGCVGLYDEEMQKKYYGYPPVPVLEDTKALFDWVVPRAKGGSGVHAITGGPPVLIVGKAPVPQPPKK